MKSKLLLILVVVVISAISYWAGTCKTRQIDDSGLDVSTSTDDAFQRGLKVGRGKQAWLQASEARLTMLLLAAEGDDKYNRLKEVATDNMWYAAIPLYDFINNEEAVAEDRAAASRVLAEIVYFFRKHPRQIEEPEGTNLVEGYNKIAADDVGNKGMNLQAKKIFSDISKKLQEPLAELESLFDGILSEMHSRDIATQAVIDHLIQKRHLPGRKLQWAGFILWMPKTGRGSGGCSGDEFDYTGTDFEVSYKEGMLTLNGVVYGGLTKGDVVDFRDEGVVIVNGAKRSPKIQK